MRNFINIINEYVLISEPDFKMPNFDRDDAHHVGKINANGNIFQIIRLDIPSAEELNFAAVVDMDSTPIAFLGFKRYGGLLMAKNAFVVPQWQKNGIASEMFDFVMNMENTAILSDMELSSSGELLWMSMINSGHFKVNIVYIPTLELFDINDVGVKKTQDGQTVASPDSDGGVSGGDISIWTENNKSGQRFFYVLQRRNVSLVERQGVVVSRTANDLRYNINGMLIPYCTFGKGWL